MTQVIQRTIGQVHDWCDVTDGIAISEASYKASSWDKAYRVIFICQDKDIRKQVIGKSLSLFVLGQRENVRFCQNRNVLLGKS